MKKGKTNNAVASDSDMEQVKDAKKVENDGKKQKGD